MPVTESAVPCGLDFNEATVWAVADINAKGCVEGRPSEMVEVNALADSQTGISAVTK